MPRLSRLSGLALTRHRRPVALIESLLPRHMQIIYQINHLFLQIVEAKWPGDVDIMAELSLIEEGYDKRVSLPTPCLFLRHSFLCASQVKMASLAIVGSAYVNGVAQLHSDILKARVFKHFYEVSLLFPLAIGIAPPASLLRPSPHHFLSHSAALADQVPKQDQRSDPAAVDSPLQQEPVRPHLKDPYVRRLDRQSRSRPRLRKVRGRPRRRCGFV